MLSSLALALPGTHLLAQQTRETEGAGADGALRLSSFVSSSGATSPNTDATAALITALKQAANVHRPLLVDGRFSIQHDTAIPGSIHLMGRKGAGDGFDLIPAPASVRGGVHGYLMFDQWHKVDGAVIEDLTFRGRYDSRDWGNSTNVPVIRIAPRKDIVHTGITVRRCAFVDPAADCVSVTPSQGGAVKGLQVSDCSADVTVTLDRSSRSANLVRAILEYLDWPGHKSSYGEIAVQDVTITGCRARGIRTLADLKRGTANFRVTDCRTEDMQDCHHSADGAFHGVFSHLQGLQSSNLIHAKNFIEVQGEDIEISDFSYVASSSLGAIAGILVTQYALPVEGKGVVHPSKNIRVFRGKISGVAHHAVRLINVQDCQVKDVVVDDIKGAAVAVENPPGGVPRSVQIDDIRQARGQGRVGVIIAPAAQGVRVDRLSGFERPINGR
jgi:hypothetical protein